MDKTLVGNEQKSVRDKSLLVVAPVVFNPKDTADFAIWLSSVHNLFPVKIST